MEPWYKVVSPRQELREGRSLDPSEFAVHLEQVAAGTAPADYVKPEKFFARNYFSNALVDHCGMVLRRLNGETANTAPVLSLITQFGGRQNAHARRALSLVRHRGCGERFFSGRRHDESDGPERDSPSQCRHFRRQFMGLRAGPGDALD